MEKETIVIDWRHSLVEEILEDFADFLLRETVDGHSDVGWSVTTINVDFKVQGQRSCGQKKMSLIKIEG